jgi:hypothetical protein
MRRVIITRVSDGREWVEYRATDEEEMMLAESVYENHPNGYVVTSTEVTAHE